ncbi:hypothetical protein B0T22DRAFT_540209 [Podospora appendiculata]|uniref:Rhodopsin domain-containing protein n=1 Tax=Podospora appendiculata TaxID=314037 RepID=A0AAE1C7C1_9PEZI|nr:hypothetical protein B0T22DRAFT_540209 [Podospora appendiculata]
MNASFSNGTATSPLNQFDDNDRNSTGVPGLWRARTDEGDLGPTTRIAVWLLVGASLTFLVLRLYCKYARHRRIHADDYFAIAAWFALLGSAITTNMAIDLGYGKHVWQIPFTKLNDMFLIGQISVTLAVCSQAWSKTSFAITLLKVSDGIHGKTRIFIWFAAVSMNLLFGMAAMFFWVDCTPLEKAWRPFVKGTCWSPNVIITYGIFTSAYSGILDLVLAIIPWKIIMNLQMHTREKFGVALAMSMGVFQSAAASAFIKCSSLPQLGSRDFPLDSSAADEGVPLVIWGVAEAAVTIMASSVPMLRILVRTVRPSRRNQRPTQGSGSGSRSRRPLVETANSSRRVYYNKPRKDLVTMTGSTWASDAY